MKNQFRVLQKYEPAQPKLWPTVSFIWLFWNPSSKIRIPLKALLPIVSFSILYCAIVSLSILINNTQHARKNIFFFLEDPSEKKIIKGLYKY